MDMCMEMHGHVYEDAWMCVDMCVDMCMKMHGHVYGEVWACVKLRDVIQKWLPPCTHTHITEHFHAATSCPLVLPNSL